jgi:hypothetical protein
LRTAELAAHIEYLKIVFGSDGSLDRLKEFALDHPQSAKIQATLAKGKAKYDDHVGAATCYEAAANVDRSSKDGLYYLGRAALEYAKAGAADRAQALIEEIKAKAGSDSEIERELTSTIRELVEYRKDEEAPIIALERAVELSPDDFDSRFSLAFKHSEVGNDDVALFHYLKIPPESRSPVAWNNLGVSFDHFKMRVASVDAYRRAEELGETLAMSNLAYKFLAEGFLKEARASFDKGFAIADHHKNIEAGLAALTEVHDQEVTKQKEALEKAAPKIDFYKRLAKGISAPQLNVFPVRMQCPDCIVSVSVQGDTFAATGTYTREGGGIVGALYGGLQEKRDYKIEYTGRITGSQIEGSVSRVQTSGPQHNSLLGLFDPKSKVLMYLEVDGIIKVMENPHTVSPNFYSLIPI